MDALGNRAAAETLCTNPHCLSGAVGRGDVDPLQVRPELPPSNTGDFSSHSAEVFRFPAMGDLIAHDGLLSAHFTCLGHCEGLQRGKRRRQKIQACQYTLRPGHCKGIISTRKDVVRQPPLAGNVLRSCFRGVGKLPYSCCIPAKKRRLHLVPLLCVGGHVYDALGRRYGTRADAERM